MRIRENNSWNPAVVTKQVNNRSYIVKTENGGIYVEEIGVIC